MNRWTAVVLAVVIVFAVLYYLPNFAKCRKVGLSVSYCTAHSFL